MATSRRISSTPEWALVRVAEAGLLDTALQQAVLPALELALGEGREEVDRGPLTLPGLEQPQLQSVGDSEEAQLAERGVGVAAFLIQAGNDQLWKDLGKSNRLWSHIGIHAGPQCWRERECQAISTASGLFIPSDFVNFPG
jgi:hypothetical protein